METKRSTIVLIRKLFVLMQHLGTLPQSIALSMKLFYYDEGEWNSYDISCTKKSHINTKIGSWKSGREFLSLLITIMS